MEAIAAYPAVVPPLFRNPITHYRQAFFSPLSIVEAVEKVIAASGISFDTIAVSGVSGMMMGPVLASWLNKHLLVVPQDGANDPHRSANYPVGLLERQWLFVDDFVATGRTHRLVQDAVQQVAPQAVEVGTLEYHRASWMPSEDIRYYVNLRTNQGEWTQDYQGRND